MEHEFTTTIRKILLDHFGGDGEEIYEKSYLLRYLNNKTRSASRGSKSRGSFANHYAVYVLVEDYVSKGFCEENTLYSEYEGAIYTDLFNRMRELPFGQRLQNHALNNRMNDEFRKFYPDAQHQPIIRDLETRRYWINENLLKISVGSKHYNIAIAVIDVIDAYVEAKRSAFDHFIAYSSKLSQVVEEDAGQVIDFISQPEFGVKFRLAKVPNHCRRDEGTVFLVAKCKQSDRR